MGLVSRARGRALNEVRGAVSSGIVSGTVGEDLRTRPVSRKVWFAALGAGGFLFVLLGLNNVTGVWPQPWLFLELVAVFGGILVFFQSLLMIIFRHPTAPRGEARKWAWAGVSARFWVLLLSMLVAPVGLVLLVGVWKQSHAWALLWGVCGIGSAVTAYLAGRPWPEVD